MVAIHERDRMNTLTVGELVEDFDLYPRDQVNSYHVSELVDVLRTETELPPIVIDKKTKVVVDGFHRRRAYIRLFGEAHEVDVVEKSYKTKAELFSDAVKYNASHGLRFDSHDRTTAILKGERLGVDIEQLGKMFCLEVDKLAALRNTRTAKATGGLTPLKATIRHKAGSRLTTKQEEANEKLSGMNQVFYVNQVITLIESDLIDTENAVLMERLSVLKGLL